jgi:DNA repair exonuclease SbcCD nuclease subunit
MSTEHKPDVKFIHFADTHLGLNWPAVLRREQIQIPVYGKAFAAVIESAVANQVDFVIHGGDLVDRPRPPTAAWSRLLQELPRLRQAGIPFIVTPGSHDKPESYFDRAGGDVLEILDRRLSLVKRIDVDGEPEFKLETKSGKKVSVYGLGDHGSEQEKLLHDLSARMGNEGDFRILLLHGSVSNMPNMAGPAVKSETVQKLLSSGLINYVALGHNHERWEHREMEVYNPGSPEYTSFADAPTVGYRYDNGTLAEETQKKIEHGFYLVEVSGEIVNPSFMSSATRDVKNIQITYNRATAAQVTDGAKKALAANLTDRSILRPIFRGTLHPSTSRTEIDLREILAMKQSALYLEFPLQDFTQESSNIDVGQSDIQSILQQYFTSKIGDAGRDYADVSMKILRAYENKKRASHQEALNIIDGWTPDND